MTLVQLRIFLAVAELGNVTKASKELGISQSAASAAIATIEDIYQVKLFDRVGRSVFLSDLGRRFLPEAQSAIASAKNATKMLRMLSEKRQAAFKLQQVKQSPATGSLGDLQRSTIVTLPLQ